MRGRPLGGGRFSIVRPEVFLLTEELPVFGPVTVAGMEEAVWAVLLGDPGAARERLARVGLPVPGPSPVLTATLEQLREYTEGRRREFDLPLAPRGTPFQRQVWDAVSRIPYGETRGYGELARELGRPTAARAVGAAVGANPLCVVVPCHRVVGASGRLTGYAYGLPLKRRLLALEGQAPRLAAR